MKTFAEEIQSSFDNSKIEALLNLKFTAALVQKHKTQFFKDHDLSPQQYNILRILRGAKKALPAQTIKERMLEKAPNTTRLMDKLKAKELIDRVNCVHDGRIVHITITQKGLDLLAAIDPLMPKDPVPGFTEEEAQQLSQLLDKFRHYFRLAQ